jgi:hypothetical protein
MVMEESFAGTKTAKAKIRIPATRNKREILNITFDL